MNNKSGFTRKYGSAAEQTSSPVKQRSTGGASQTNYDSVKTASRIPGFDISPEKEGAEFQLTTTSKEKTDSSLFEKSNQKDTQSPKVKENDSLPSTPKNITKRKDSEDVMTPLPNISYQAAILESIEQSALKVKNDDSFTSEIEDSPLRLSKKQRRKHSKNSKEGDSLKKRRKVSDQDSFDKGEVIQDKEKNKKYDDNYEEDDDDEEESGLVIDLDIMSPVVKHSSDKVSKKKKKDCIQY
jgi:hypothetical protein